MSLRMQAERDQGLRAGATTEDRERIKALERENRGNHPVIAAGVAL